ncbi:MAG TPA: WYL domain-containing protein [Bacteriovoracaceae bacterium]|nr:WYL domain-containing protein [Bacteriovoracaceae bacterium]
MSPTRCLSADQLKHLLGNPPKSTWHRLINELTEGSGDIPALLMETLDKESGETFYCVNQSGWQTFLDAHEEGRFLLECYRQIGYLLDSDFTRMVFDLPDLDKKSVGRMDRKFLHLVKVRALKTNSSKKVLNTLIEALVSERQLELTYDGGLRTVRPLTLCQHRDELYLMCYRLKDGGEWEKRTYKLARISGVRVLERKFPYPSKSDWDPMKEYENSSGLVLGQVKRVQVRVYGHSRKLLAEKDFFGGEHINTDGEFDTYLLTYTNAAEFLGQLFVYAQDVEIVDDEKLREEFVKKAEAGLHRNRSSKVA